MKRHRAEEIVRKVREAEALVGTGKPVAEVCRQLVISEPTLHRWRERYGGMTAVELKRLKALETENTRLKKAVADLTLDKEILKEALQGKY